MFSRENVVFTMFKRRFNNQAYNCSWIDTVEYTTCTVFQTQKEIVITYKLSYQGELEKIEQ